MTLNELKHIAHTHPEQIEICWDKIASDPSYKQEFEAIVIQSLELLPELESIYTKLSSGKNVVVEGEDTALDMGQVEEYIDIVEEELFAGYQLSEMWERYTAVTDLINSINKGA